MASSFAPARHENGCDRLDGKQLEDGEWVCIQWVDSSTSGPYKVFTKDLAPNVTGSYVNVPQGYEGTLELRLAEPRIHVRRADESEIPPPPPPPPPPQHPANPWGEVEPHREWNDRDTFDRLNGKNLKDGEKVEVLWVNGKVTKSKVTVEMTYQPSQRDADLNENTYTAYIPASLRRTRIWIKLNDTDLQLRRRT